jgi:hypothetical protein
MTTKGLVAGALVGSLLVAGAGSAGASTSHHKRPVTLRLYDVVQKRAVFSPDGKPGNVNAPPVAGDHLVFTDFDYVGTSTAHSAKKFGKTLITCHFTSVTSTTALGWCKGQLVIGKSRLLEYYPRWTPSSSSPMNAEITGGTGRYAGAHGTIVFTPSGDPNISSIALSYST